MSEFLSCLSLALSQPLEANSLLSLEQTDSLYDHFEHSFLLAMEGKVPSYRQLWPSVKKEEMESKLNCFRNKVDNSSGILFSRGFDHCGAVRLDLHTALQHVFELILIDRDSVRLLDESGANGLSVDSREDGEPYGEGTYEMVIWGNTWLQAIKDC